MNTPQARLDASDAQGPESEMFYGDLLGQNDDVTQDVVETEERLFETLALNH
jgi:hypothetical protein